MVFDLLPRIKKMLSLVLNRDQQSTSIRWKKKIQIYGSSYPCDQCLAFAQRCEQVDPDREALWEFPQK